MRGWLWLGLQLGCGCCEGGDFEEILQEKEKEKEKHRGKWKVVFERSMG